MHEEHPFTLPRGYLAPDGTLHREGSMRPALAGDEIQPLEDPRVKGNRAYLVVLLLARVITRLGTLSGDEVTPAVIERLFSIDLAYLQTFYRKVNGLDGAREATCPHCGKVFTEPA
jgi:hypothetical protein